MAEIAGAVGSFVGVVLGGVKWVATPIIRQFNYLRCFSSNIDSLKEKAQNLDYKTSALQGRVDADRNNAQVIFPIVETWLADSDDITLKTKRILDEAPNVGSGGCLKFVERFSLSKEAKKTSKDIEEHLEKYEFDDISHPPPIAAIAPVPSGAAIYEFESRRQIEEEIMTTLEGRNVNTVGICGMGGVGKTTMAKKIMNRAFRKGFFDEVMMAVVSQPVEKLNVQLQIAEQLGLRLEDDTLIPRANKLRKRLMKTKRALLVLDDVWERLDVEELGIPCGDPLKRCIILLTSRNNDVLRGMKVGEICGLQTLSEAESWFLFRERVGTSTCVDDTTLNPIAKDVARECKGLPIALAAVGVALKDEDDKSIWEDALSQLRKSNPLDIPNIITEVYNPLKLSYDRLDSENAKSTFLLCCLFREDDNIRLEELTYFAMGLRLYRDIGGLEEVRGRVRRLINTLKRRCLLLDGLNEDFVRMHDVIRDVSIFIASQEKRVKCSDCTWISSFVDGRTRVRVESGFPKLNLLFMDNSLEQEIDISEGFIGGTAELNVLSVRHGLLKSLPQTTQLRTSLTTLFLYECKSLESISVVGQFKSLEILICRCCPLLEELPVEATGLECLRLLEISQCEKLERVAPGVISSLVGLEELKTRMSFDKWEGEDEGRERKNSRLREVESLTKLRCLEIQVLDESLAAQPLCLSPKLVKFDVQYGEYKFLHSMLEVGFNREKYKRRSTLYLSLDNNILGDLETDTFLTSTESLNAMGIINGENSKNMLREKGYGPVVSKSFKNLKELGVESLPCSSTATRDCLLQLERISIQDCHEMEQLVFEDKENDDDLTLTFPELKRLHLNSLKKLTSICRGIESIQFPKLEELDITSCRNMKCFVSTDDDDENNNNSKEHYRDHDSLHLFCQPKVSFGNLKKLRMSGMESNKAWCDEVPISFFSGLQELTIKWNTKIKSLFSSSIAQNLVNLQKLDICYCWEMVSVIEDTSKHSPESDLLIFPSLQDVTLSDLPKLESFCKWRSSSSSSSLCDVQLPSLKTLRINKCGGKESFTSVGSLMGFITPPALQTITIDGKKLGVGMSMGGYYPNTNQLKSYGSGSRTAHYLPYPVRTGP